MTRIIDIQSPDGTGTFHGYLATPPSGRGPAVVLCQEIFGVNAAMRALADQFARDGYVAVVPDLFWRLEPDVELGYTPKDWERAMAFMQNFDQDVGAQDIAATLQQVRALSECAGHPQVGVVGYCLGGKMAYLAACRTDAAVSVGYYGVGISSALDELPQMHGRLVLHLAAQDEFSTPAEQQTLHAATAGNPQVTLYDYPGMHHAFARPCGDHYDATAATLAHQRTLEALRQALGV